MNAERTKAEIEFADIINMEYHGVMYRQAMPMSDRAAQFSPFAALVGYEDAVKETVRLTDSEMELSEDRMAQLNQCVQYLRENIADGLTVKVVYFVADERKNGGKYITYVGKLRCIDDYSGELVYSDGMRISFSGIYAIDIL